MIMIFRIAVFFLILFFLISTRVSAQSGYVLPYPSVMPGGLSYKIHSIYEIISKYWYFGDFGQFNYNLKMADKYLVEAKTLFEYKQYLLGHKALKISDLHYAKIISSLEKVNHKKKDISNKKSILKEAALKHIETLKKIGIETPDIFNWQPEKVLSTNLYLKIDIEKSINIRKKNL